MCRLTPDCRLLEGVVLLDAYRKFRSLIRRPIWLAVGGARPMDAAHVADVSSEDDDVETHEAPDKSHVTPPAVEPTPRDESIELLERRLDVLASRADRLERSIEALSPVRIAEMPSRGELRAIEELAQSNRSRGEDLQRRFAELKELDTAAEVTRAADHAAVANALAGAARIEEKQRDATEELRDVREASTAAQAVVRGLRDELNEREKLLAAEFSRRLAGAYTVAIVALFAALMTLVLYLVR